jgi:2-haloacid dehalogenase
MSNSRRKFLKLSAGGLAISMMLASPVGKLAFAKGKTKIKAVAFDAFPIFDPRPAFKVLKEQFPEHGEELQKAWFSKIFGYTWLRTSADQYKSFWQVMEEALRFTTKSMKLELPPEKQHVIMQAFLKLPVWPDVIPALEKLKAQNIRLAFLSNMSEEMLQANMKLNNIDRFFEAAISTDEAKEFKPAKTAYQLGVDKLKLTKDEIAFAAFAGWDAAGASWFGYPTVWVNRLQHPAEELGTAPDATGADMNALVEFIEKRNG